jgi:hypothetical protein
MVPLVKSVDHNHRAAALVIATRAATPKAGTVPFQRSLQECLKHTLPTRHMRTASGIWSRFERSCAEDDAQEGAPRAVTLGGQPYAENGPGVIDPSWNLRLGSAGGGARPCLAEEQRDLLAQVVGQIPAIDAEKPCRLLAHSS